MVTHSGHESQYVPQLARHKPKNHSRWVCAFMRHLLGERITSGSMVEFKLEWLCYHVIYFEHTLIKRGYPWLIWSLAGAFFFLEYFARVAPSVMVPELMRAFSVSALGLGSLAAVFYYAYISMQLPVGALVDRFGPHRLLTIMAALCAVSCFLFAFSHDIYTATIARFLMGFSAAFAFVGALKLTTIWFSPTRFGLLAGMTQALGMLGAAMGEGPLSVMVIHLGWRETMWLIGIALATLAILIGLLVRDKTKEGLDPISRKVAQVKLWPSIKRVLHNPQTWINGAFAGLIYAPTQAFAELWGTSYLGRVYDIHTDIAADAVSLIFIGWAVGGPLVGWISDRIKRRCIIMKIAVLASLIFMSAVLYLPNLTLPVVFVLLFLYGVANSGLVMAYAVAGEINPKPVAGTSLAFTNMSSVLIGAGFQPLIGWFLTLREGRGIHDALVYSAHDYRVAMMVLPLCFVACFIVSWFVKETHCQVVVD